MKTIKTILIFGMCLKASIGFAATGSSQPSMPAVMVPGYQSAQNALNTLSKIPQNSTTAMPNSPLNGSPECSDTQTARHAAANEIGAVINNSMVAQKAPSVNLLQLAESCFTGIFSFDIMPILAVNLCGMAYNYFMSTSIGQEIQTLQNTLSQGITLPYGGGNIGLEMQGGVGVGGGSGPTANTGTESYAQSAENLGTNLKNQAVGQAVQNVHSFGQSLSSQMQSSFGLTNVGNPISSTMSGLGAQIHSYGYTSSPNPTAKQKTLMEFGNLLQQMLK